MDVFTVDVNVIKQLQVKGDRRSARESKDVYNKWLLLVAKKDVFDEMESALCEISGKLELLQQENDTLKACLMQCRQSDLRYASLLKLVGYVWKSNEVD